MNQYDPNVVIAEANQKLISGDWEGGQFIYQSYLLEWTDDARESGNSTLEEAICTLYTAYAQYLITAKQYKTATLVYEDAINSSATILKNSIGRIYQEYTRFLLERDKRKSAQEVFIKALVTGNGSNGSSTGAVQDEQDRDILWNDFLAMMQINNPNLTMKTLRQAMMEQYSNSTNNNNSKSVNDHRPPPSKRQKFLGSSDDDFDAKNNNNDSDDAEHSKTHVIMVESVEEEAMKLVELWSSSILLHDHNNNNNNASNVMSGIPPDIMAAWISRDGNDIPHPPNPPLFAPSPPKLSDPVRNPYMNNHLFIIYCLYFDSHIHLFYSFHRRRKI